jgi:hypothetical protein
MTERLTGELAGLEIVEGEAEAPVGYALALSDGRRVPLNGRLGAGLRITFLGVVCCRHCGAESRRSFGGGYCYDCFTTLARCDLCVVSPHRCHYDAGTCREPTWGEGFCMQPHRVYLANSSGLKVGITRSGRERGRWLDQGAIQGLVILEADSRRDAGLAEVSIGTQLADRTDWRKMLRSDVPELDLESAWQRLRESDVALPDGVRPARGQTVARFHYPLSSTQSPASVRRLEQGEVRGNLKGMKGQYLLVGGDAMNIRAHAGYRVEIEIGAPFEETGGSEQLGLFG